MDTDRAIFALILQALAIAPQWSRPALVANLLWALASTPALPGLPRRVIIATATAANGVGLVRSI